MFQSTAMNSLLLPVLFAVVLGWSGPASGADDAVRKKLADAKLSYDSKIKKNDQAISEWLEKREEAARKAGNKKKLDEAKADRKAFDENRVWPANAPVETKKQLVAARAVLESAMATAVKEYIRAKMDDEAAAVEKELYILRGEDVLLGTWKVAIGDYRGEWTFKEGGIVDSSTSGAASGKWVMDTTKGHVMVTWLGKLQDKFDLPLNPKGTMGSQVGRTNAKLEAVKLK